MTGKVTVGDRTGVMLLSSLYLSHGSLAVMLQSLKLKIKKNVAAKPGEKLQKQVPQFPNDKYKPPGFLCHIEKALSTPTLPPSLNHVLAISCLSGNDRNYILVRDNFRF